MRKPVFIIGLHRAGSTLLRNILNSNPELAIIPEELHVLWQWEKDLYDYFLDEYKRNNGIEGKIKNIVDLVYSEKIKGGFCREWGKLDIDKDKLVQDIKRTEFSIKGIVEAFLSAYAQIEKKKRVGAKYIVHFSKAEKLLQWFPDCKIIHITRDPRAICFSKVYDEATSRRKKQYPYLKFIFHYGTLLYFIHEFNRSSRVNNIFREIDNYYLIRFEDLVSAPKKSLSKLCEFLEVRFSGDMMHQKGKPSSYNRKMYCGFDVSRLYNWQKNMSKIDMRIITLASRYGMNILGYKKIEDEYRSWRTKLKNK